MQTQRKQLIFITILSILFITGHYYCYTNEISMYKLIRMLCNTALTTLCLLGSIYILMNSQGVRSRKIFAFTMTMVGFASLTALIRGLAAGGQGITPASSLSPVVMIYGNTYAWLVLIYPIELLSPGKTNLVKHILLFLPILVLCAFYYLVLYALQLPVTNIDNLQTMVANIGKFDVWFRFAIFVYPIWILFRALQYKSKYTKWCQDNYTEAGYVDLDWLRYYVFGFFVILVSYTIVVFGCNPQSMLMHNLCFFVFFGYSLYKVIKQQVPPALTTTGEVSISQNIDQDHCLVNYSDIEASDECANYRFVDKIEEYKVILETWMLNDKPYSNKDFKLLDVMAVLPLNRSYLSRMFNEAYGETFFSFVMRYRLEESMRLLVTRPDLTITRIAQMCGFSSASVYSRAFLKNMNMTPKEYRINYCNEDIDSKAS